MRAIAHREVGCGWRPRHPLVCMLDIAGCAITLALLAAYPQKFIVAILPWSIAALYAVSCLYHWLPVHAVRQKLDHLMIAVVIAVTYLPFWWTQLPTPEPLLLTLILGALFVFVCALKLFFISRQTLGGIVFLIMGLVGTLVSFNGLRVWLPTPAFACFWLGLMLYLLQFAIYAGKKPDLWPEHFGFRELQHVLLLWATTLHSVVVLRYL